MGPLDPDRIKRAHLKLMRLDPDYARRFKANCKRTKTRPSRSRISTLPELDMLKDNNHLQFVRFYDDTLDRLDVSSPSITSVPAGKPHVARERLKAGQRYEVDGEHLTISQLADRFGLDAYTIRMRLYGGSTIEDAVKPVRQERTYLHAGKALTLKEWARETGINIQTIRTRLQAGWSLEAALTVAVGTTPGRRSPARGWVETSDDRVRTAHPGSRDIEPKQDILQ